MVVGTIVSIRDVAEDGTGESQGLLWMHEPEARDEGGRGER